MKLAHFELLSPICPVCRKDEGTCTSLEIKLSLKGDCDSIEEGILLCSSCQREYPIINGVPILVGDVRNHISNSILHLYLSGKYSPAIDSLIGDCCGPNSAYDLTRQYLSTYAWGHYHDLDPESEASEPPSILRCVAPVVEALSGGTGPIVDVGCSVGRTTFEIASRTRRPTIGLDVNLSMLFLARRVMSGHLEYPLRDGGLVYHRKSHPVDLPGSDLVDFWAADATCLPLKTDSVTGLVSLNLLDCVASPTAHLKEVSRVVNGICGIGCPYDWSPNATHPTEWIGAHSFRSDQDRKSSTALTELLIDEQHPMHIPGIRIVEEFPSLPWRVRVHRRSMMEYQIHLLIAESLKSI